MTLPREFERRIRLHNRHAVMMSGICLFGAWVTWTLAYGIVVGLIVGFLTVIDGQAVIAGEKLLTLPWWIYPAALSVALGLFVWAAWDEKVRRYAPVDDRPVVGWHIFADVALAPARLTFGVWHHLSARISLSRGEKVEALAVLQHIAAEGRCPALGLGAYFSDLGRLRKLLRALQLAGWIDLHGSSDEPFYVVRSDEADAVQAMLALPGADEGGPTGT